MCTFSNRSAPDRGKWCGPSGPSAWTVHHVQNHTLLGHSPLASQAGRRVGPALYSLRPMSATHRKYTITTKKTYLFCLRWKAAIGSTPPLTQLANICCWLSYLTGMDGGKKPILTTAKSMCPASPEKEDQTRADSSVASTQLALCLRLASMNKAESWQRAVTLDNSTPQCRMCKIRVWPYNPFLRSRHHRQVKLAVKT